MADVVVHDMIERIYFYSIIFSQNKMGSEKHKEDVVVPVQYFNGIGMYMLLGCTVTPLLVKILCNPMVF
jgi:hypothetical protein